MREIKFRAWDKRQHQMSKEFTIVELTQYEHHFESKFSNLAKWKDLAWLEWTGLKDKNGVEIYEGDVVRAYYPFADTHYQGCIRYVNDCARFSVDCGAASIAVSSFSNDIEVIGNIHGNPELLEAKHE